MAVIMVVSAVVAFGYVVAGSGLGMSILAGLASVIDIVETYCKTTKVVAQDDETPDASDDDVERALPGNPDATPTPVTPVPTDSFADVIAQRAQLLRRTRRALRVVTSLHSRFR